MSLSKERDKNEFDLYIILDNDYDLLLKIDWFEIDFDDNHIYYINTWNKFD